MAAEPRCANRHLRDAVIAFAGMEQASSELRRIVHTESNFEWLRRLEFAEIERLRQHGPKCCKLSHDGLQLACGDSSGNIRVYETDRFEQVA